MFLKHNFRRERGIDRRIAIKKLGFGLAAASLVPSPAHAAPKRRLKIGQTGIAWGFTPADAEPGIKDTARLGYYGYESLGETLEAWEAKDGLGRILTENKMPLPSTYFHLRMNIDDPSQRKEELRKLVRWGNILKKYGGSVGVLGPNHVDRAKYDFTASKAGIVATLNEAGKSLSDLGLDVTLHPHTDTCVMTREEAYSVMESVDTRYVKFGPDVGQFAKMGYDPVKIVKDFAPVIRSVHLKDFLGGPHWAGYCPLGQGNVDLPAVMEVLETAKDLEFAMVELDGTPNAPMTPFETAKASKEYLEKLGYTFKS
jgi:inosose dehydratase